MIVQSAHNNIGGMYMMNGEHILLVINDDI